MRWPVHIPRPAPSSIPSPGRRAEVNVTAKAWIQGAENAKLSAANLLSLVAATAENNNIYTKAYSYGFTAGGTGSVVSKAVNNTKLYGQIDILGDQSELHGKDIYVSASAPRESEVQYRKEAKYRAETVTEFVKQTVERITTTIEKVAEKVIKWLPWPVQQDRQVDYQDCGQGNPVDGRNPGGEGPAE